MDFEQAMAYMSSVAKFGSVLGLDTIKELLKRLKNPEDDLNYIHVAGTNGKGSTAAYIATILAESGYKVGRYVSPVITDYCERIELTYKAAGKEVVTSFIEKTKVAKHITQIQAICNKMVCDGFCHPTPFEIETAMAFMEFKEQHCDIVILEVGMGGRLDATNVIKNTKVAVLTSISMDHMHFLGNTLEEIGREKAGIIKPGCRVVSYEQKEEVKRVIKEKCIAMHTPLVFCSFSEIRNSRWSFLKTVFDYKEFSSLEVKLLGDIQEKNAALAIEAVLELKKCGYQISKKSIEEGLKKTEWKGRFEKVYDTPLVLLDGAHNEGAAFALSQTVQRYFQNTKFIMVVGMFADKEYDKVLNIMAPFASRIYTVTPENSRALPSKELANCAKKYAEDVYDAGTIKEGLTQALVYAKETKNAPVLIFGSLSFHSTVYAFFNRMLGKKL